MGGLYAKMCPLLYTHLPNILGLSRSSQGLSSAVYDSCVTALESLSTVCNIWTGCTYLDTLIAIFMDQHIFFSDKGAITSVELVKIGHQNFRKIIQKSKSFIIVILRATIVKILTLFQEAMMGKYWVQQNCSSHTVII